MNNRVGILFTILLCMVGTKAFAHDIAVVNADGMTIYYNYINDGRELEVTYIDNYFGIYSGDVVIPEEVTFMNRTRKVTSIGEGAFIYCKALTSVTIPNSVNKIGGNAFADCDNLTSVHISNLEAWCNISFRNESSNPLSWANSFFLNGEKITDLMIPNNVTSIGDYVFFGWSGLNSVTIPNNVTSIGKAAFAYCINLTFVAISNSVTFIGNKAFYSCI
ncbi:MAG: leucine-rich repeat domain-containing protein [Prevotella sp.]|nr:leucine-rich repeat domain-containing protein [Prevotella sp.]